MIRYTLLTLAVTFLSLYAFRDWYRSLCGLIVLMAFLERDDMPRQMLGITGLNPWNVLIVFIVIACFIAARREKLKWDLPRGTQFLLVMYLVVILVGFARMLSQVGSMTDFFLATGHMLPSLQELIADELLNTVKYAVPGLLLFYGCNSRSRLVWGLGACLLTSLLLGLQIIQWMGLDDLANADALSSRALRVLDREIGYHRVDLAAIMAGASWSFFICRLVAPTRLAAWFFTGAGTLLLLSLALTGGRAGYVSWGAIAMLLAVMRWKKLIVLMPILIVAVVSLVPAARDRFLEGFGEGQEYDVVEFGDGSHNYAAITSDRVLIWPVVIDAIGDAPLVGYGREGYHLSGASRRIIELYGEKGEGFPHPHNAYLEIVIDNGLIGAFPILLFFYVVVRRSAGLFKSRQDALYAAVGGAALAFVFGQLVASLGAQSFYPRAGVVVMWALIGLALRAHVMWQQEHAPTPAKASLARMGRLSPQLR